MDFRTLWETEELFVLRLGHAVLDSPQFEVEFLTRIKRDEPFPQGKALASALVSLNDGQPGFERWEYIDNSLRDLDRMLRRAAVEYVIARVLWLPKL